MLANISKTKAIKMLGVIGIGAMLFSFSFPWGGEGFKSS